MADQVASFRYDSLRIRVKDSNVVISNVAGAHVETTPMEESIFLLSKGRYTKIAQTGKIRKLMREDYDVGGDALINHLKASGNL